MPGFASPLPDDRDKEPTPAAARAGGSSFGLFRRSSDPRHPPLSLDTYARLIYRALTERREAGQCDAAVLWVPLAHVPALATALATDGYELDLLSTDHNAAGGVAMGFVHVARVDGGNRTGGMHQPMPGV